MKGSSRVDFSLEGQEYVVIAIVSTYAYGVSLLKNGKVLQLEQGGLDPTGSSGENSKSFIFEDVTGLKVDLSTDGDISVTVPPQSVDVRREI
jgi:hypothetical protein